LGLEYGFNVFIFSAYSLNSLDNRLVSVIKAYEVIVQTSEYPGDSNNIAIKDRFCAHTADPIRNR
jgi:hypothetical protein